MPEPEWTRIGTTSENAEVMTTLEFYDGSWHTFRLGKMDLYVEMYKVQNDNHPGKTNYACVPTVKQWPGKKLENAIDSTNELTWLGQDWTANEYGGLEITDWGPTEPKTDSLNWSMSVSAGSGGGSAGLSVSYNVPYISREITSNYNETVSHKYTYPSSVTDPLDAEAKNQIVSLRSLGEAWLDDEPNCSVPPWKPCPTNLLTVNVESRFQGVVNGNYPGEAYSPEESGHITEYIKLGYL